MTEERVRDVRELIFPEPILILTGRLAHKISLAVNLKPARQASMDPEVRNTLIGIELLARQYSGSAIGTSRQTDGEPKEELLLTTTQAAEIAGVTGRAIRKAIAENRLEAQMTGSNYLIRRASLRAYMTDRP
jgi:excisionase family DNA binding protein